MTDVDLSYQSIFATTALNATASTISTGGQSLNMWELHTTSNDGRRRYIDGWLGVDTSFILTPTAPGSLSQLKPFRLTIDQTPPSGTTTPPAGTLIRNAALHPDLARAFIITAPSGSGQPQLWRYTRHDHAFSPLLTLTSADAPICTSRQGDLFILLGSQVRRFKADGVPQQLNAITPSATPTAMAYNDSNDQVVALLPSTRKLVFMPRTLSTMVEKVLPSSVQLGGNETITIGSNRTEFEGKYVITSVQHIYVLGIDAATARLILEDDISITGLTPVCARFMDNGHLLVSNGATLSELRRTSSGWAVRPDSVFAGLPCGTRFEVSRSRSNLDRAFHTSPGWDNIVDPMFIPEQRDPLCSADFNGDGDSGTDADIEAFFLCLAGTCCPMCLTADFNRDGDTGTDADIESFFRVLGGGAC